MSHRFHHRHIVPIGTAHINVFSSRADADRYPSTPDPPGVLLGAAEAAATGRAPFGGLCELLAAQAAAPRLDVGLGSVVGVRSP